MCLNNATLNGKKNAMVKNFWDIPTRGYTLSHAFINLAKRIQKISAVITHIIIPEDTTQNHKLISQGAISYECIMDLHILTMTFLRQGF